MTAPGGPPGNVCPCVGVITVDLLGDIGVADYTSIVPEIVEWLHMNRIVPVLLLGALWSMVAPVGCARPSGADSAPQEAAATDIVSDNATGDSSGRVPAAEAADGQAEIVLAGGCFWCMEVAFDQLNGVLDVVSGYAGGTAETADYRTVSAGLTKHAEAIRISYDPEVISLKTLLDVFFTAAHDPTQINRQYPDVGRQYRSTVFFATAEEKQLAESMIADLNQSGQFPKKIATTLEPLTGFYMAEDYHQDYVKHHPDEPYVVAYSLPKAAKVRKAFPDLIRAE